MWLIMQRWTYLASLFPVDSIHIKGRRPLMEDAIAEADRLNRKTHNECRYFVIHKSELPLFNLSDPNP